MSEIKTNSGIMIDPLRPRQELIKIEDIAHSLSMLCRANGHFKSFYSVCQHSINCMQEARARGYSRRVQLACLLHDGSEAYLSDVTRPVKEELPLYRKIEEPLQEMIWQKWLGSALTEEENRQVFAIDDERLLPMYEEIQGKLPVIFHMGDHRFDYSHPKRLRRVLECFPKLQVIAAHFGAYELYEEAYGYLKDTDCFFDVSSSLMFMGEGVAESYVNRYGAERFVYGSDYPMWDPAVEMQRFLKLKLTDDQFEQIAHKTAKRILGI